MKLPKPNDDDKLAYEILDLQNKTSASGKFATYTWPMINSLATLLLTLLVAGISLWTQSKQANVEENLKSAEQTLKKRELLDETLKLATDSSGGPDRRIAGIRSLGKFWSEPDYEEIVASTLVAELGLEDKDRFARCAAADVLGEAMYGPDSYYGGTKQQRSQRIAKLLFGNSHTGEIGLVSRENELLQAAGQMPKEESDSDPCLTAIGASREAIRSNWGYLRDANLNETSLYRTRLYEADLAGSSFILADVDSVDFKCANLYDADFGIPASSKWMNSRVSTKSVQGSILGLPDFSYANVKNLTPTELADWIKDRKNGFKAVELEDSDWQLWRKNGFRVDSAGVPVLDPRLNSKGDSYPCERIAVAPPKS